MTSGGLRVELIYLVLSDDNNGLASSVYIMGSFEVGAASSLGSGQLEAVLDSSVEVLEEMCSVPGPLGMLAPVALRRELEGWGAGRGPGNCLSCYCTEVQVEEGQG